MVWIPLNTPGCWGEMEDEEKQQNLELEGVLQRSLRGKRGIPGDFHNEE